jgi:transposase
MRRRHAGCLRSWRRSTAAREQAAKIGGMVRQTLQHWVIRFNEQGPDGLVNKSSPGAPGKLIDKHKTFLARLVEEGSIRAMSIARRDWASVGYSNVRIGIGLHRRASEGDRGRSQRLPSVRASMAVSPR